MAFTVGGAKAPASTGDRSSLKVSPSHTPGVVKAAPGGVTGTARGQVLANGSGPRDRNDVRAAPPSTGPADVTSGFNETPTHNDASDLLYGARSGLYANTYGQTY